MSSFGNSHSNPDQSEASNSEAFEAPIRTDSCHTSTNVADTTQFAPMSRFKQLDERSAIMKFIGYPSQDPVNLRPTS
ncbi:hypothetical protein G7Y89_g7061 [Cudoniella acicularis]|uniref:Uncharacterized protein n=1 Tax=Cudoniella acicularis TaxID=354080 RepID=A0A8H4RJA3_9HELO|nr:hypothetical protein G7Y89_g7061 [Cudoniella acicularis]